jgi:lipopolysaccharide/colanic/teichoic acid biosynthesis glycosyltransferase
MGFIVNGYNELCRQRLRVKPGITGIWQISTDRTREIHEDISYDLFYVANRSLFLDVLILLRTIPALFFMKTC